MSEENGGLPFTVVSDDDDTRRRIRQAIEEGGGEVTGMTFVDLHHRRRPEDHAMDLRGIEEARERAEAGELVIVVGYMLRGPLVKRNEPFAALMRLTNVSYYRIWHSPLGKVVRELRAKHRAAVAAA